MAPSWAGVLIPPPTSPNWPPLRVFRAQSWDCPHVQHLFILWSPGLAHSSHSADG